MEHAYVSNRVHTFLYTDIKHTAVNALKFRSHPPVWDYSRGTTTNGDNSKQNHLIQ